MIRVAADSRKRRFPPLDALPAAAAETPAAPARRPKAARLDRLASPPAAARRAALTEVRLPLPAPPAAAPAPAMIPQWAALIGALPAPPTRLPCGDAALDVAFSAMAYAVGEASWHHAVALQGLRELVSDADPVAHANSLRHLHQWGEAWLRWGLGHTAHGASDPAALQRLLQRLRQLQRAHAAVSAWEAPSAGLPALGAQIAARSEACIDAWLAAMTEHVAGLEGRHLSLVQETLLAPVPPLDDLLQLLAPLLLEPSPALLELHQEVQECLTELDKGKIGLLSSASASSGQASHAQTARAERLRAVRERAHDLSALLAADLQASF